LNNITKGLSIIHTEGRILGRKMKGRWKRGKKPQRKILLKFIIILKYYFIKIDKIKINYW